MIAERLHAVRAEMARACARVNRAADAVTLVAVSKGHPADAIRAAHAAGQQHFGENYADELTAKMRELADVDVVWHFIGRVQSGNAKVIARAHVVHGVGSTSQAEALDKAARKLGKNLPVLLQVNLEDEASKNGFTSSSLAAALPELRAMAALDSGLTLNGLMAMPDVDDVRPAFAAVRALRDRLAPDLPWLSMGMSGDYDVAIEEGATHVRVGTAIFGPRATPKGNP
ncbi:MAG: YggS family pyridoxal phosphate-dependent enzyme [Deltaproteobacteria bacterium]|nr:YggS family pyridoxal phosphate-dependent enzyme [Deltaproteobacteria bacterium]